MHATSPARRAAPVVLAVLLLLLPVLALPALTAAPARAAAPERLAQQVTDEVGALDGSGEEVEAALQRLVDEDRIQLWVAYVATFDGLDGADWARETFLASGFGTDDVLLAVAVEDRAYGYWTASGARLSTADMGAVARDDVEPRLGRQDWAGAVVAAADGVRAEVGGSPLGLLAGVVLALVLAGGGLLLLLRHHRTAARGGRRVADPPDPFPGEPTAALQQRADALLVQADDAVRASEQ
ncbi:TPM domain-containing protein, partial [Kineococcus glutinatus]|uniref:TPM domain-containing protein n=1 Tax=Kineococcus glutinatus TaxID=1070872 RepID=UPI0031EC964D